MLDGEQGWLIAGKSRSETYLEFVVLAWSCLMNLAGCLYRKIGSVDPEFCGIHLLLVGFGHSFHVFGTLHDYWRDRKSLWPGSFCSFLNSGCSGYMRWYWGHLLVRLARGMSVTEGGILGMCSV